ncbi:sn-glycerol-3-phosphate transporter [Pseudomonas sp. BCA14]|uniref:sn-glycerol-3-phosphate transporter n=1 Tax=unclassified Pseudomonas TaxID=196821 RepID=UPI00106E02CD|nr:MULTISPECIES: sn-glycerol-3-phosphate transporter [unclassified Pseudomonas]TFF07384.1 sn-glycerol-3-phosphate transporter [Pseudomonas sp. JMN1]TFF10945.1 sn-glycerol-3-phosphate transporter [Pseudomonas sp. BCA17]TFF22556.1 sn-glycerol-3-phosphate transporter [Pseudomonas sp. BCA13]TFF26386.1 sn-glycerol-3-phosphate transporter [Pseudomonas sp. BCA14]
MKYLFTSLLLLAPAATALATEDEKGFWYAQTSLYTRHFSPDPQHNNHQDLINLERNEASGQVYGAATFRNSFSQRSYYVYAGKRYDIADSPLYVKVTAGALQGYRGQYRDKIPLNKFGVAPAIIPSVGVHAGPVASEFVLLGFNAAMLTAGVRF